MAFKILSYNVNVGHLWKIALSVLAVQFIVRRVLNYRRVRKVCLDTPISFQFLAHRRAPYGQQLIGDTPVDLCLFAPFSIFSMLMPRMGRFWNPSMAYTWVYRRSRKHPAPVFFFV